MHDPFTRYHIFNEGLHIPTLGVTSVSRSAIPLAQDFFRLYENFTPAYLRFPFLVFVEEFDDLMQGNQLCQLLPAYCIFVPVQPVAPRKIIGPKFCVYSAPEILAAIRYLFIDIDTWPMTNLHALARVKSEGFLLTHEKLVNNCGTSPLSQMTGIYNSTPDEIVRSFSEEEHTSASSIDTINTGVLIAGYTAACALYNQLVAYGNHEQKKLWLDLPAENGGFTDHREQALVNLAIGVLSEQGYTYQFYRDVYNYQMMHNEAHFTPAGKLVKPRLNMEQINVDFIAIAHFNGLAGEGPTKERWMKLRSELAKHVKLT